MAKVGGKKIIKANIIGEDTPINANIVQNDSSIKSVLTTYQSATTERKGIIRIATDDEAIQGTDTKTAITPHTLKLISHYIHEQGVSSDTWTIQHKLNKYPSVTLVDTAGTQFQGRVEYIDENNCIVYMNGATKGKAYLN